MGETGDGYLAGLYVGKAEAVTTYYDGLARNIQTRAGAGASDIVIQTGYNRAGKPDRLLGPVRLSPSHTYDALTEAAAGNRKARTAYHDDPLLRVSRVVPPGHTGIDYPGRFTVTQQYDNVGNVTSQNYHRAASETRKAAAYTYDNLHRLTGFNLDSGANTRAYTYDRNGNLFQMTTNGAYLYYFYSSTTFVPNRILFLLSVRTGVQPLFHNKNGWTTRVGNVPVTYDYRGLTTGYGSARYLMDPDRRRVKKTVGTAVTYYLRGADGSVLAEYDGNQALTARYVYAGSRRIARIAGNSASYYLADHLGSTRSLIDEAGAVTAAYDYWPYGKVLASSGTGSTHFRFTGHERDAESSLDYMPARLYAFNIGRFLRPDPMQDQYPGISPYAYAANNPLKYVDPDGNSHHEPQDQIDLNQIVQDRYREGYEEVTNAIANLPSYVQHQAQEGAEVVADYALDLAETSVKSGIVVSDALSIGSTAGMIAGTTGIVVGAVTRSSVLAAGATTFTTQMMTLGTVSDISSSALKTVDAVAFDGSYEAAGSQVTNTLAGFGGTRLAKGIAGRAVARTASSTAGPMFYRPSTGQFVSHRFGFTVTAAADATSVGVNIAVGSLISP